MRARIADWKRPVARQQQQQTIAHAAKLTPSFLSLSGSPEQALSAFDAIESDYERHCHLAREIAEEYFDAKKVAQHVLEQASA